MANEKFQSEKLSAEEMIQKAAESLLDFVTRASKEGAAPAEVDALPETARMLLEFCKLL